MGLPTRSRRRDAVPEGYDGSTALPNTRWELFCQNFTGEHVRNASASYRAAGYKPKNGVSTASLASKLLINDNIQKRIDYLNEQALKVVRLHRRHAVERLSVIASAKLTDYQDEAGNVDPEKVRDPVLSQAVDEFWPVHDAQGNFVRYHLKLLPPMKAMEMLGLSEERKEQANGISNTLIINRPASISS